VLPETLDTQISNQPAGVEPVSGKAVWKLLKDTASSWSDINAPRLGAALAFYTMLSIAPLMIVCIGIAGFAFGKEAAQGQIMSQLSGLIGTEGAQTVQTLVQHASKPSSGIIATSAGIFLLLFGASGVFGELRDSLNTVWGVKPASYSGVMGFVRYRFVSFAMVLGIGFLLLVSLILSAAIAVAGTFFGNWLPASELLLHSANVLFSLASITVLFALTYKLVPDVDIRWRDVWIGAAVTAALFTIGKTLIGLYLGKASVGSAYGAAGSLVVFILWVYYSAQIFFLGAQFTRTFSDRHGSRAQARQDQASVLDPNHMPFKPRKAA
jgi:membrane protein